MITKTLGHQAGYTLIELLVAMLLLGLIGLAIAGGVQFGSRVWERSETDIATTSAVALAQGIVRAAMASALPHQLAGFARFDGERDEIVFYGPAPQALGVGGLARFQLSIRHGEDGDELILHVAADGATPREAILADHLEPLHIDYMDGSERIPTWLAVWRDRDRLPDAVRIKSDEPSSIWPLLIVRSAIAQDASCQFDPVSASCRKT